MTNTTGLSESSKRRTTPVTSRVYSPGVMTGTYTSDETSVFDLLEVADQPTYVIHTLSRLILSEKLKTFCSLTYLLNILNISLSSIINHLTLRDKQLKEIV